MAGVNDPNAVTPANAEDWVTEVTEAANDHEYKINNDIDLDYTTPPPTLFVGQNDGWGQPRPNRYSWPPIVVWDIHFQLFPNTTALPVGRTAWVNALARYTGAEMDTNEKLASNCFAIDSSKPLGRAYTHAIEQIMHNSFGHISVKRIDKFSGITPQSGGFSTGGRRSTGIDPIVPEFYYEMIARVTDKRPDWYPNTSLIELTPWAKHSHMFGGNHFDAVAETWLLTIEGLGYRGRVYYDEEIIWTRRPSRHEANGGTDWPYTPGTGGTSDVEYPGYASSVRNGQTPGTNPIPDNATGTRYEFNP